MKIEEKYEHAVTECNRLRTEIMKLAGAASEHAKTRPTLEILQVIEKAYRAVKVSIQREQAVRNAGPNDIILDLDLVSDGPTGPTSVIFARGGGPGVGGGSSGGMGRRLDTPLEGGSGGGSISGDGHRIGAGGSGGAARTGDAAPPPSEWLGRGEHHDYGLGMRQRALLDLRKFRCAYPYRPEEKRVSLPLWMQFPNGIRGPIGANYRA